MKLGLAMLLSALVACAAPLNRPGGNNRPPPPRLQVDRRCEDEPPKAKERCALLDNRMPSGPGGGTCWEVPLHELAVELEVPEPLPFFRRDGTAQGGELPLLVTSAEGHLKAEIVLHVHHDPASCAEEVTAAPDACAELNLRRSRLTSEEHQRQFGCPPCPCAWHNGQVTCAPCVACEPIREGPDSPAEPAPASLDSR